VCEGGGEEKCEPNPKPSSADVAGEISVRSSGNLCVGEEYV
jgi:hypothetical protein